jgi:hypothetical protein
MMPKAMMARVTMLLEEVEEEDMMVVVDIVVSEIMVAQQRGVVYEALPLPVDIIFEAAL